MATIRMEQRVKTSPTSPFFHANHVLHKQPSNDDISIVSSFDSRSMVESRSFISRQIENEGMLPHGSRTQHFAEEEEEEEEDLGLSLTNSTVSLHQLPTSSTLPLNLSMNTIQRSRTTDPDHDNATYNGWESTSSLQISTEPKKYHYLTRSQSALTYPPKSRLSSRRSFYGYGASTSSSGNSTSFFPMTSSPLRTEFDPREPEASEVPHVMHRRSQFVMSQPSLSPIDERSLHEKLESESFNYKYAHSDNASMHSNLSTHSSLFINRPVNSSRLRSSASTSTFGSTVSFPPRTPNSTEFPSSTHLPPSPVRSNSLSTRKVHRSFTALSIIPASPRASQSVSLHEGNSDEFIYANLPPSPPYPGPSIILPTQPSSVHSKTPSLLTKSESLQTELTYLTAPDSIRQTPSSSNDAHTNRFSDLLDRMSNDGHTIHTPNSPTSPATAKFPSINIQHRCNAALDWVKSTRMPQVPKVSVPHLPHLNRLNHLPHLPHISLPKLPQTPKPKRESGSTIFQREWWENDVLPAEALFWMGFIGPWCWLIGGWMLTRGGTTEMAFQGGSILPRYSDESNSIQMQTFSKRRPRESWYKHKDPSTRTFTPGASSRSLLEHHPPPLRPLYLLQNQRIPVTTKLNPWVLRCRIAAVTSGLLILAALAVVLLVLFGGT